MFTLKNMLKVATLLTIFLSFIPVASAAGLDGMTDQGSLNILIGVSALLLLIAVGTLYSVGVNIISISTMLISGLGFLLTSRIFINGTLIYITQTGAISEPIRNSAMSFLFQFVGLLLIGLTIIQAVFIKNRRIFSKKDFGEWDYENEDE